MNLRLRYWYKQLEVKNVGDDNRDR